MAVSSKAAEFVKWHDLSVPRFWTKFLNTADALAAANWDGRGLTVPQRQAAAVQYVKLKQKAPIDESPGAPFIDADVLNAPNFDVASAVFTGYFDTWADALAPIFVITVDQARDLVRAVWNRWLAGETVGPDALDEVLVLYGLAPKPADKGAATSTAGKSSDNTALIFGLLAAAAAAWWFLSRKKPEP